MKRSDTYEVTSSPYDYATFYDQPTPYFNYYMQSHVNGHNAIPLHTPGVPQSERRFFSLRLSRELPWMIVFLQTVLIVALLLILFGFVMHTTGYGLSPSFQKFSANYPNKMDNPVETTSLVTLRRLPKFGERMDNTLPSITPSETAQSVHELAVDLVAQHTQTLIQALSASAEEPLYKHAAVISNDKRCSEIGNSMLVRGGNAVDAAIASLFCLGVTQPQSSGLGGGFMAVYCREGECFEVNARETAPSSASRNMFSSDPRESTHGYKAVAVPGELNGLWRLFERFSSNKVAWHDIVWPSIELARKGFTVGSELAAAIAEHANDLMADEGMRHIFVNPRTANLFNESEAMVRPQLAETLQQIAEAEDPVDLFYKEELAEVLVKDMRKNGGILSRMDMEDYEAVLQSAICNQDFHMDLALCGPRPPASFVISQLIASTMNELYPATSNDGNAEVDEVEFYHRLLEAEKFSFAQRISLGDPAFVADANQHTQLLLNKSFHTNIASNIDATAKNSRYYGSVNQKEDHGTSHVSVIDEYGGAVSLTSSVNLPFGSKRATRLGFLFNSQMDAFSIPNHVPNEFEYPSAEANYIQAGKAPMSSFSPLIVMDKTTGQPVMSLGAVGGTKIVPLVSTVLVRTLLFGERLSDASNEKLIYSQFIPNSVFYEEGFDKDTLSELTDLGHQLRPMDKNRFSVFGLRKQARGLETTNDLRNVEGGASGY